MSDAVPEYFKGFAISSPETWNSSKLVEYKHKTITPTDVVVKNIACGICGSDVHAVKGHWGPLNRDDLVVGHEIVGNVVAVGHEVKDIKIGQRVGIGASTNSSGTCRRCLNGNEQYCKKYIATYNSFDYHSDNYVTQGGYSSHSISDERFVFPIPEKLESNIAGPLMCAGLTVYSPLVRRLGRNAAGKTVGIVGIGGLGHLAIQFANALGAKVVTFSRSSSKKEEALAMGSHEFIATAEDKDWAQNYMDTFDVILNCSSGLDGLALDDYLSTLTVDGKFISTGVPAGGSRLDISPFVFLNNAGSYGSSYLGSKTEAAEMLQLAADKDIKPWVEEIPLTEANFKKAYDRFEKGDVRYRFVFTEFDKAFGN